jgi:protein-tyrosine phosphatase
MDLVDLHNHLVPGVDDGARTTAESLSCLHAFADDGVRRMAVSPHLDGRLVHDAGAFYQRLDLLESTFHELQADLALESRVPELVFSQEIMVPDPETAALVFLEPRVGIRGTRYALIEFGFELPDEPASVVRTVRDAGRRPIVAHPERYRRNGEPVEIAEIMSWKDAGATLQVNGGSLLGNYGPRIAELAWEILARGLARLVATDHHGADWPVSPAAVSRKLSSRGAGDLTPLLFSENPRRVLDDRVTLPVPPHRTRAND